MRGVDLSFHRARSLEELQLKSGDLVLAMEEVQARTMNRYAKVTFGVQLSLLGLWCSKQHPHLEDPFSLPSSYFDTCFSLIDDALGRISKLISEKALKIYDY